MNSDLLKRLFKAINQENVDAIEKIASSIIENEKNKGHLKLAEQLEILLHKKTTRAKQIREATSNRVISILETNNFKSNLQCLPTSKRDNQPLLTFIPHSQLRHHMVLPKDIEERFVKIEKEYAAKERLANFNLKPIKKVLLYGDPGCGKTMGAERLAWNIGLPVLKVRFDALISSYFGESISNLRTVFESSVATPCVLLLDECDFIATARHNSKDIGEVSRIVNMLLQFLDDYDAPGLLVATTNLQKSLDKAIFRRFDEVFEVPKPSKIEIKELLTVTLSAMKTSKNIKWDNIIEKLRGYSPANIVKVAEKAAKNTVLSGKNVINEDDIYKAIEESTNI
jgi:SpoVK/Ycf46/Vps4 family AAA+-type ATPase